MLMKVIFLKKNNKKAKEKIKKSEFLLCIM